MTTNIHKNIGKRAKLISKNDKMDVILKILAVTGNLYVCRSEGGDLMRINAKDVKIID